MAPTVQTILLTQKGEVKQIKIPGKDITIEIIQKLLKSKNEIDLLATYEYATNHLYIFGAIDGKAGTENQHELPPPHDAILVFGDLLLIASADKNFANPVTFTTLNYEKFYQHIFEGEEEDEEEDVAVDDVNDDDDGVVEEEEEEEEEEDEEEEEEDEEEGEEEEGDKAVVIVATKAKAKKKAAPSFLNSGKNKQNLLMQNTSFKVLEIDTQEDSKGGIRKNITNRIGELIPSIDKNILEHAIFKASMNESDKLHIISHWDNPLFENIYKTVARRIITNLYKDSYVKNSRLIQRAVAGEFTLEELAGKNPYELYPELWKDLADRQIMREQKLLEGNKGMATDQFKCHGCGKRECTFYEMQTRSADEPMTIFITCLNCGKRWRQ